MNEKRVKMKRMFLNYIAVCSDMRFFDKFIIFNKGREV